MTTIHSNGKQVLIVGNPFFDENGNVEEVLTVMRDLTELIKLKEQLTNAEREREEYEKELMGLKKVTAPPSFVGEDASIKRVRELIDYVATTDATVLITGETGAGKEVISREIYSKSKRKDGPYVKVNCAAIPENLLESELFGYVKGAFTGADKKDKVGLFEVANGGTILLDEISEMPLKLQTKLLRVLQEREIVRVGDTKSIKIDVRVIAATNQALEEQIRRGLFREDLYYRLNVFPIQIPPLRQRKSDIALLANSFLIKYNALYEKNKIFTPGAIRTLTEYESLTTLGDLLTAHGWTPLTALCVILFSLMHWPCSTTLMTIRKETGSRSLTALAFLLPTVCGMIACALVNGIGGWIV